MYLHLQIYNAVLNFLQMSLDCAWDLWLSFDKVQCRRDRPDFPLGVIKELDVLTVQPTLFWYEQEPKVVDNTVTCEISHCGPITPATFNIVVTKSTAREEFFNIHLGIKG